MGLANRRHHEARVKRKFRKILENREEPGAFNMTQRRRLIGGVWRYIRVLNPRAKQERQEFIDRTTNKMAHHPKHFCQMCKRDRYKRERFTWDGE